MTIEEYKNQPFKYDGDCNPVMIGEMWSELDRRTRREIERLVKAGRTPNIMDYL